MGSCVRNGPTVSVVMGVFNGERFVARAVESILSQTFTDFEFIIIDDGSTDGTARILESFDDKRMRIHRQENQGLTKSLNRAIGLAQGDYVARMDADDISLPRRLELQMNELLGNRDLAFVSCQYRFINANEEASNHPSVPIDPHFRLWLLQFLNPYRHGSVMMRRDRLTGIGGYNERFRYAQDYDLWLRLSTPLNNAVLPQILYLYRTPETQQQVSKRHLEEQRAIAAHISNQALMTCNPSLTSAMCRAMRALYWDVIPDRPTPSCMRSLGLTLDGFCKYYGIRGRRRLELEFTVTFHAINEVRHCPRWPHLRSDRMILELLKSLPSGTSCSLAKMIWRKLKRYASVGSFRE